MNRIALALALALLPSLSLAQSFRVEFSKEASAQPLDGRLLLCLSTDPSDEPRNQINDTPKSQIVFGVTVDGWKPGETQTVDASASFTIYARDSGDEVGKLVAPHATVSVASRRVGKRQFIRTALGRSECVPIEYVRTTSLGPMVIAGEQIVTRPTQMRVTDWYCPAEAIVMRQDVSEDGKVQHIETTVVEALPEAPLPAP